MSGSDEMLQSAISDAEKKRRIVLRQLINLEDEQRKQIARELHDEMGQSLAALMFGLGELKNCINSSNSIAHSKIKELEDLVWSVGQSAHRVAWELRPTILDDLGLPDALQNYVSDWGARSSINTEISISGFEDEKRLDDSIETTVFRFIQEALTNVLKHAQASRVNVWLEKTEIRLSATVEDNGIGFAQSTTKTAKRQLGLVGMKERLSLVDGHLEVKSESGKGTIVTVSIPLLGE